MNENVASSKIPPAWSTCDKKIFKGFKRERKGEREREGEREEAGRGREGFGIFNEGGSLIENGR